MIFKLIDQGQPSLYNDLNENSKYYGNAQIQIHEFKIKYKRRGVDQPSLYINSDWDERSESGRRLKRDSLFLHREKCGKKY